MIPIRVRLEFRHLFSVYLFFIQIVLRSVLCAFCNSFRGVLSHFLQRFQSPTLKAACFPCREQVMFPLQFTGLLMKVDFEATVEKSNGYMCEAGAVRHALALALRSFVPSDEIERMRIGEHGRHCFDPHHRASNGGCVAHLDFVILCEGIVQRPTNVFGNNSHTVVVIDRARMVQRIF